MYVKSIEWDTLSIRVLKFVVCLMSCTSMLYVSCCCDRQQCSDSPATGHLG